MQGNLQMHANRPTKAYKETYWFMQRDLLMHIKTRTNTGLQGGPPRETCLLCVNISTVDFTASYYCVRRATRRRAAACTSSPTSIPMTPLRLFLSCCISLIFIFISKFFCSALWKAYTHAHRHTRSHTTNMQHTQQTTNAQFYAGKTGMAQMLAGASSCRHCRTSREASCNTPVALALTNPTLFTAVFVQQGVTQVLAGITDRLSLVVYWV